MRKTSFPIFSPWFVVPEPGYHRRGLGLEAARLMMAFGESAVNPVFITITVAAVFGAWHGHKSFTPTTSRMLTSTLHSFVICIYHLKLCGCVCRCEKQYVGNTALVHSFVELCVYNNYYWVSMFQQLMYIWNITPQSVFSVKTAPSHSVMASSVDFLVTEIWEDA
jgi:hypothetical protein